MTDVCTREEVDAMISEIYALLAPHWVQLAAGVDHPPASSFLQIATGHSHSCGVKGENTAVCWGDESAPTTAVRMRGWGPDKPGYAGQLLTACNHPLC